MGQLGGHALYVERILVRLNKLVDRCGFEINRRLRFDTTSGYAGVHITSNDQDKTFTVNFGTNELAPHICDLLGAELKAAKLITNDVNWPKCSEDEQRNLLLTFTPVIDLPLVIKTLDETKPFLPKVTWVNKIEEQKKTIRNITNFLKSCLFPIEVLNISCVNSDMLSGGMVFDITGNNNNFSFDLPPQVESLLEISRPSEGGIRISISDKEKLKQLIEFIQSTKTVQRS